MRVRVPNGLAVRKVTPADRRHHAATAAGRRHDDPHRSDGGRARGRRHRPRAGATLSERPWCRESLEGAPGALRPSRGVSRRRSAVRRDPGEVVELGHRVVAKLGVRLDVHLRALARLDVFPLPDSQRLAASLLDQLGAAGFRCAEQRRQRVEAVGRRRRLPAASSRAPRTTPGSRPGRSARPTCPA